MEAFQYADDSDGEIGGLASDCIEVMENLVLAEKKSDSSITLKLFNRLLEDSNDHLWRVGKCNRYSPIVRWNRGYGSVASTAQDVMANRLNPFCWFQLVPQRAAHHTQLVVVYGTDAEALQFEEENSTHASFRKCWSREPKRKTTSKKSSHWQ